MGGIPNRANRSSGATAPTAMAHQGPQRKPASRTGICMGLRALPIWGICPVRKGSTMHRARHTAVVTIRRMAGFAVFVCIGGFSLSNGLPS